jgi:DNA relaxase NicK
MKIDEIKKFETRMKRNLRLSVGISSLISSLISFSATYYFTINLVNLDIDQKINIAKAEVNQTIEQKVSVVRNDIMQVVNQVATGGGLAIQGGSKVENIEGNRFGP